MAHFEAALKLFETTGLDNLRLHKCSDLTYQHYLINCRSNEEDNENILFKNNLLMSKKMSEAQTTK